MALTIAIEGTGVIANCDDLSDTAGGEWSEEGGGTMTLSPDVFLVGSGSIGGKYANKSGFQQYDLGSGNELNFNSGGNEYQQLIYMWVNMAAFSALETLGNYGLCVRVSSDSPGTSNYKDFTIAGSDGSNGWTGGWKLFVIDPTRNPSRESGTLVTSAVRTLGIWIETTASIRAESLWIDQISVGKGLRITGSSTTPWADIVAWCTDYASRGWGMVQEREGIIYVYGHLYFGDSTQGANVSIQESSSPIVKWAPTYFYSESSTWINAQHFSMWAGLTIEDSVGYSTLFEDGIIVGTDKGRAGSILIGHPDLDMSFDLYGGNNAASLTKLYGTQFIGVLGGISMGDDSDHLFYGGSVTKCGNFDPVGAPKLRNILFSQAEYKEGTATSLYWRPGIDIERCQFVAITSGGSNPNAITHTVAGTYDYKGLTFSGNDYDVRFTPASGDLVINNLASGGIQSNASTSYIQGSGSVTFNASFTHKLTGVKENTEVTYTEKPTPYDSLTGLAFYVGDRVAEDIAADWTPDEFKGKLLVVSTAGANEGRYYVVSNDETTITMSEKAPATQAVSCDIYGAFDAIDHTEDVPSDGENEYIYVYASGTYVDILIFHVDYEDIILEDILLDQGDATIPIVQIPDVNFFNPS
jgi:hypothetical protein